MKPIVLEKKANMNECEILDCDNKSEDKTGWHILLRKEHRAETIGVSKFTVCDRHSQEQHLKFKPVSQNTGLSFAMSIDPTKIKFVGGN